MFRTFTTSACTSAGYLQTQNEIVSTHVSLSLISVFKTDRAFSFETNNKLRIHILQGDAMGPTAYASQLPHCIGHQIC